MQRSVVATCSIALALVSIGCDADDEDEYSSSTVTTVLSSGSIDVARAATFAVLAEGCGPNDANGTSTLIDVNLAITAAHVVAGADRIALLDVEDVEHPAEVVYFDPHLDVALLRAPTATATPIMTGAPVSAGDPGLLFTLRQHEGTRTANRTDVVVVRTVDIETTDIYLEVDVTRRGFEIEAEIEPGDSGSVVLLGDAMGDAAGVGMVWARSTERTGRAWAIDFPEVVTDAAALDELVAPVDNGRCVS